MLLIWRRRDDGWLLAAPQMFVAMHALKGQQLLAQGNALGLLLVSFIRPEGAKALIELRKILELLPLQGEHYRL